MKEWKEYKLGNICSKIGSGATPWGGSNAYKEFGIPLIRSQNVLDFSFSASGLAFIDENQASELKNVIVNENDILLNITGDSVARCCVVPKEYVPARVNQHVAIIRPFPEKAYFRYIFYYLQFLKPEILIAAEIGATRNAITKGMIEEIDIPLPPLPEQRAIAAVLSSLDDKIDLLHRQNATLEAMAEALFRQWFVVEAREEWETVKVVRFVKTNQRTVTKDYPFREIEYLDTSSLNKGMVTSIQNIELVNAPSRAKRLVQNNDILISTVRPDQKHYGIIRKPSERLVVSTGFCVITCIDIDPHFIYLLLTTEDMTEYLHSIAEGSTSTYPSLKPHDIEEIEFALPPKALISRFGELASSYWDKIHSNQTQIRTLTALRDTLLPKLMSGEVRVKM